MDTRYFLNSEGELCHWGIKGMKWGVRRYQNKDGSLTPAGEKRRAKLEAKIEKISPKKSADEEVDIETRKAQILQSRSPKALYENAHLFDTRELNDAYMRLSLERNIKNLQAPEVSKGEQFVNNFIKNANTMSTAIESGSRLYNNVARVFNSVYGNSHDMHLPTISDSKSSKLEKFKEETEWKRAKNERNRVDKETKGEKSEADKLGDDLKKLKNENELRKQQHIKEEYDKGNWNLKEDKDKKKNKSDDDEEDED